MSSALLTDYEHTLHIDPLKMKEIIALLVQAYSGAWKVENP